MADALERESDRYPVLALPRASGLTSSFMTLGLMESRGTCIVQAVHPLNAGPAKRNAVADGDIKLSELLRTSSNDIDVRQCQRSSQRCKVAAH